VLQLKTYSSLAHGAKFLVYFCYGPSYLVIGDDWSNNHALFPVIAEMNHEIGMVEDLLCDAAVKQAETALLFSRSTDIWSDSTYGQERSYIYLALMHEQIPVDIVTEEDVVGGCLRDYKLLYLVGSHILPDAAGAVREWVREGGVLWSDAGSGLRDHFNRPLDTLHEVYGIRSSRLERNQEAGRAKLETVRLEPIDEYRTKPSDVLPHPGGGRAYCVKEVMEHLPGAEVVGTYADGSAAIVYNAFGQGVSVRVGAMPAVEYVKDALDRGKAAWGSHGDREMFVPSEYAPATRQLTTGVARAAGLNKAVELDHDRVETTVLECGRGITVPLVNYRKAPIEALNVRIACPREIVSLESVKRGTVAYKRAGNRLECTIPLDRTDMLVLRYK